VQRRTIKDAVTAWRRRLKRCWPLGIWKMIPLDTWIYGEVFGRRGISRFSKARLGPIKSSKILF